MGEPCRAVRAVGVTPVPPIAAVVKLIGTPTKDWEGNCFGIASQLAPHVGGVAVYGHYLGPVAKKGYWAEHAGQMFQRHGWIVVPDGTDNETIIDPTRWSFEAKKPYIWTGKNDGSYDEGGNKFRGAMLADPRDLPSDNRDVVEFYMSCEEAFNRVGRLVGDTFCYGEDDPYLDRSLIRYLANVPPDAIGWFWVAEVYDKIIEAGELVSIPIDNLKMVHRRRKLRKLPLDFFATEKTP